MTGYHHPWEPFHPEYGHVPKWVIWRFKLIYPFIRRRYR